MENYYEIFNVNRKSKKKDVIKSYNNIISKYNYTELSKEDIYAIKILKKGLYILSNRKLRKQYNKLFSKSNEEPKPENEERLDDLDSLFKIDNSFKNNNLLVQDNNKTKLENNLIGDRIFSLSYMNKKPIVEDRKPLQGRIEKKLEN
jgi:hypothetical protein